MLLIFLKRKTSVDLILFRVPLKIIPFWSLYRLLFRFNIFLLRRLYFLLLKPFFVPIIPIWRETKFIFFLLLSNIITLLEFTYLKFRLRKVFFSSERLLYKTRFGLLEAKFFAFIPIIFILFILFFYQI